MPWGHRARLEKSLGRDLSLCRGLALLVARGIRSSVEFKFVRKLAELRANEAAEMFGVGNETLSRW